jgi:hypothetical protein
MVWTGFGSWLEVFDYLSPDIDTAARPAPTIMSLTFVALE